MRSVSQAVAIEWRSEQGFPPQQHCQLPRRFYPAKIEVAQSPSSRSMVVRRHTRLATTERGLPLISFIHLRLCGKHLS